MQQISDYELELMKIIWANNATALYAEIAKGLEDKEYHYNAVLSINRKRLFENQQNRAQE